MSEKEQKEKPHHEKKEEVIRIPIGKLRKNLWIVSTIVLGIALIVVLFLKIGGTSGDVIVSKEEAGSKLMEFVNAQVKGQGIAELVSTEKEGSLYKATVRFNGQEFPLYVTQDGQFLITQLIPLDIEFVTQQTGGTQQTKPVIYSNEDLDKLGEFNSCLATNGVKIYGANWCGWTKKWVETLGGFDAVKPIYVECTENEEICSKEGIQGFPTIKINGQPYDGERSIEAIAKTVGCAAPDLTQTVSPIESDVRCG